MLNTSLILAAAEEGHHVVNELPMDPIWYGLLVFALLMAALAATCLLYTSPSPRDRG